MNNPKVILITGASSGMGKETAIKLIKEGHTVFGAARRIEKMQPLIDEGGYAIEMDITKEKQLQACLNRILKECGRIDVLINNAGYAIYGSVEETTIEDARNQFDVNLFGLARLTQLVIPHMRKQNSGKIINISSMGGKIYTPLGAWYHATKHALEGWSDCLRLELKQFNIDVVIIQPGAIATEFGDVMMKPMLERSGSGPYAELANAMAAATKKSYEQGGSSHPDVIAKVISKAISAKRPRIRYVEGKMARPAMLMRKLLGDRLYDKAIMSRMK